MTSTTHTESVVKVHLSEFRKNMNASDITIPVSAAGNRSVTCQLQGQCFVSRGLVS